MSTALVTGGSRGIGRSLARSLRRRGFDVVITGRNAVTLEEVVRAGDAHRFIVLDASDTTTSVRTIRALDEEVGGLDLVIANAGVGTPAPDVVPYAWESMAAALHTNVCGAAATLTAALPAMVARDRGHIVGIGSLASFGALPGSAAYCTPKSALSMLLDCLRLDLAGTHVTATTVHLGFVRTEMVARSTHPLPQLLEPEAVGERIAAALERRPRTITMPLALAAATFCLARLPRSTKELLARRLR